MDKKQVKKTFKNSVDPYSVRRLSATRQTDLNHAAATVLQSAARNCAVRRMNLSLTAESAVIALGIIGGFSLEHGELLAPSPDFVLAPPV